MSPLIQPDTSAAIDMTFKFEPGTYKGKIDKVEFEKSAKGNPMIVVYLGITHEGKVYQRRAYLVITGEGAHGFDQLLRACGFTDLADQYKDPTRENPQFDTDTLVGHEINVVMDQQLYEKTGQMRDFAQTFLKA